MQYLARSLPAFASREALPRVLLLQRGLSSDALAASASSEPSSEASTVAESSPSSSNRPSSYQGSGDVSTRRFTIKISPIRKSLSIAHILPLDVLHFLQDPSLKLEHVRFQYSRTSLWPEAVWVVLPSAEDAAAAAQIGNATLGAIPMFIEGPWSYGDMELATHRYGVLSFDAGVGERGDRLRSSFRGRAVVLTCGEKLSRQEVLDAFQDYDLVWPRVRDLHEVVRMGAAAGNNNIFRTVLYFSNADEAQRALRTKHLRPVKEEPVRLRVLM